MCFYGFEIPHQWRIAWLRKRINEVRLRKAIAETMEAVSNRRSHMMLDALGGTTVWRSIVTRLHKK